MFQIVLYWCGGLRAAAGAFFCNLASLLLIVLNAQSWGLLLGGLFMDPKTAQAITTVVMLSFLLVSGFYVRDVPVWIGWLKYLSFIYWGYNLLLKIEFRHRSFNGVANLKSALRLAVNPNKNVWPEVVVLLGMLLALRVATYFVLRRKTRGTKM
jgi:ABC-type multidrug transport system permease subunit